MRLSKRATLTAGCVVTAASAVLSTAAVGHASGRPAPASHAAHRSAAVKVPPQLRVPDGNSRIASLRASGVQTYTCVNGAWTFLEPAATLWAPHDVRHRTVALHSRGPVWVSTVDGSAVNAAAVPGAGAPRTGAVPELLLKATATRGEGVFGSVSYIQRLRTRGGVQPTGGCTTGAQTGVPYTATYVFYAPSS
ncbi:DUF3455 domain-containing protein [Streptomyces sp. NPDC000658]|uniref:DUF3455 domain-containing protein n=1 Tax=Streptomyces sp. NPDC000658 TaxID=3154266 RepID=UPI0033266106